MIGRGGFRETEAFSFQPGSLSRETPLEATIESLKAAKQRANFEGEERGYQRG